MKFFKFFLFITLILLAGYYFRGALFPKSDMPAYNIVPEGPTPGSIGEQIQEFSLSGFSESGSKNWHAVGKTADILAETIHLTDVKAKVYGEEVTVDIMAREGEFLRKKNDVELRHDVVVVTTEGTTLTTQKLRWHANEELIDTDEYVLIEREDMDIEGIGGSARHKLNEARIDRDVKVTIKDPPGVITCDGPLEVDYSKKVSYFNNNVKLDDGKVQIYADRVTAYFDPERRMLSRVYAVGNVKIIRDKNVSYSKELTYLPDEGRVVLGGRPKIIIHDTEELLEKSKVSKK